MAFEGYSLEAMIAERALLAERVAVIDATLADRGVRVEARAYKRARPMQAHVLALLADGPRTTGELVRATGRAYQQVATDLWKLLKAGEVVRVARGVYALPGMRG